jgi:PBP1b-binding outer membrane lipoprotein LpoB
MRSGASRCGLALLALLMLSGCASATKKHYLKHLSTTIAPVTADAERVATANEGEAVVAAANPDERPR